MFMDISVVIPCYGSEETIRGVVNEIIETMAQRRIIYEILLVNDCSPDGVWDVITQLVKEHSEIKGISLAKNFGQHSALMAGYRHSRGEVVISMDDDGQTPANELFNLVDKLEEGHDVVYATYENKQHSLFRNLGSKVNDFMCEKLLGKPHGLMVTSYFAAKRFVIEEMCKYDKPYTYVIGLVFRSTKNIATVPVHHRARAVGQSGYSFGKLIGLWLNGFTAFSIKPLRLASVLGIMFSIFGFIGFVYLVIKKLLDPNVPVGWSSVIASVWLIGGVILFTLGMIGEYLGRVYISMNASPQYVIKEIIE